MKIELNPNKECITVNRKNLPFISGIQPIRNYSSSFISAVRELIGNTHVDIKVRIPVVLKDSVEIVPHVAEVIVRGKIIDTETATNDNKHTYIFCPNDLTLQHVILAHELVTSKQLDFLPIQILNIGFECVNIKKNTIVGYLEPLSEQFYHRSLVLDTIENKLETKDLIDHHTRTQYNRSAEENFMIAQVLRDYSDIFSKYKMDLGKTDVVEHQINTSTKNPISQPLRKLPLAMEPKIEALIENLKASNIIRESSSPWSSPIVAVRKSDGQVRMCVDYRKLNIVTERSIFPIPDAA